MHNGRPAGPTEGRPCAFRNSRRFLHDRSAGCARPRGARSPVRQGDELIEECSPPVPGAPRLTEAGGVGRRGGFLRRALSAAPRCRIAAGRRTQAARGARRGGADRARSASAGKRARGRGVSPPREGEPLILPLREAVQFGPVLRAGRKEHRACGRPAGERVRVESALGRRYVHRDRHVANVAGRVDAARSSCGGVRASQSRAREGSAGVDESRRPSARR
jgi:hypothetical protein